MTFHTAISEAKPGRVTVRGFAHDDLIGDVSFAAGAFLTLTGRLPSAAELELVNAMLNSVIDHGFVSVTTATARYAASGNPQLLSAVAAGLLAIGDNTLSPQASYLLLQRVAALAAEAGVTDAEAAGRVVHDILVADGRIPGLGHPIHESVDYRAEGVFRVASRVGIEGRYSALLRDVHRTFLEQTGKRQVPINIDGCLASVSLDLGLSLHQAVGLAVIGVMPGLIAHVAEEIADGVPLRYIEDGNYTGESARPLPESAERVPAAPPDTLTAGT